jgi:hypothetical protein
MDNKFKGLSGAWLTKQLFYETSGADKSNCLYTLKDSDHKGYPSVRRLYIEMEDETEYLFAEKYFGGWPHWKRLLGCSWFMEYLEEIREELSAKLAARNLQKIREKASEGDLRANQYLIEKKWDPQAKDKVGRPSKEKIKEEAKKLSRIQDEYNEDYSRLMEEIDILAPTVPPLAATR